MRQYEVVLIFSPDEEKAGLKTLLDKVGEEVKKVKGKVESTDEWGRKELAYPIRRFSEGVFYLLNISLPPDEAVGFGRKIDLEEKIIRHLIVRKD